MGRLYNFSALDVYENAVKCVETLGLPHSTHAHIEGYENEIGKRNLITVLEKIKSLNIETSQKADSDLRDALIYLNKARSILPHTELLKTTAHVAFQTEDYDLSIDILKQALQSEPENITLLNNLSINYFKKGDYSFSKREQH